MGYTWNTFSAFVTTSVEQCAWSTPLICWLMCWDNLCCFRCVRALSSWWKLQLWFWSLISKESSHTRQYFLFAVVQIWQNVQMLWFFARKSSIWTYFSRFHTHRRKSPLTCSYCELLQTATQCIIFCHIDTRLSCFSFLADKVTFWCVMHLLPAAQIQLFAPWVNRNKQ